MSRRRASVATAEARLPLTRERVLDAAIGLADEGGIEALSMRRLAEELGVEAMSLYHYVGSKDELLGAIMDRVVAEIPAPAEGRDWKGAIRASAIAFHDALQKHAWVTTVLMSPKHLSVTRLGYMDALLTCLREAGLPPELTHYAYHALDSHIVGSTLWEAGYRRWAQRTDPEATAQRALELLPPERHPYFYEHMQYHFTKRPAGATTEFEFGLELILDGVERLPRRKKKVPR